VAALKELSPVASDLREDFIAEVEVIAAGFYEEVKGNNPISGFGDRAQAMSQKKIKYLQAQIGTHFTRLIDQLVANFDRTLLSMDAEYRAEKERLKQVQDKATRDKAIRDLDDRYSGQLTDVRKLSVGEISALVDDVEALGHQAKDPSEFIRLYMPTLENMGVEEMTRAYEDVEIALHGVDEHGNLLPGDQTIDIPYVQNVYGKAQVMLRKLEEGNELDSDDYEEILAQLSPFFDTQLDTEDRQKSARTMRTIEASGAMTVVHAMTPKQRMKMMRHFVEDTGREPSERRQGLLAFASADYLTASQVDVLCRESADLDALSAEEKEQIENGQELLRAVRARAAHDIHKNPSENFVTEHFTGSNALIYEIFGRVAIIGIVLSAGMNWKNLPSLATDPIFLTMVGVAGLSYDHVTGGIGSGGISQTVARVQIGDTDEFDIDEALQNRLAQTMSDYPDELNWLRDDKGAMLKRIDEIAAINGRGDDEDYIFKFDDLIDDIIEKENTDNDWSEAKIESRRADLEIKYKQGMGGRTVMQTQAAIANIYLILSRDIGLTTGPAMLAAFDSAEGSFGIGT
jgi:hypothetical protein